MLVSVCGFTSADSFVSVSASGASAESRSTCFTRKTGLFLFLVGYDFLSIGKWK